MAKPTMGDDELLVLIDQYASASYGYDQGTLAQDRAQAIARYNCELYGNEIDGKSQLVSTEIRDTVETVIPQLMRIFLSGDNICEFDPETEQDVQQAKQESKYVNWMVTQKNAAFQVFGSWFRDALLCKNGYTKAWWEERSDVKMETYKGLPEDSLAMVQQDESVEIIEHTEYPAPMPQGMPMMDPQAPPQPMLHDIKVRRNKTSGYVRIDNVPTEEILVHVSTRGPDLRDAIYVEHRTNKTLSEIRQMGYEVDDHQAGTMMDIGSEIEAVARDRFSELQFSVDTTGSDPSTKRATFREVWMRVDLDGDGIAELRKLCLVNRIILANEETDLIPIACITPVIQPHRHVGYGYYDFLKQIEEARTAMLRSTFDNMYLANNGRYGVDVNKVNVDDMLISRAGGIVRTDGPPGDAIFPLTHPSTGEVGLSVMNYLNEWKKNATGVIADAQALSADVLNKSTASGISQAISVWQARVEGVARCFSETGMTDLFRIVHALTLQNATQAEKVQLSGEWVVVDPREWTKRTSLTVTVGLGTGSKEAKLQYLQQLGMAQQQGMAIGIATPENIYETAIELTKEMGYKDSGRFWTDPKTQPPPQPHEDPIVTAEKVKAQAHMEAAQMKVQADAQIAQVKQQSDMQVEAARAQASAASEQARANADMQVQQHKIQTDGELELAKTKMQLEVENIKHTREQETALQIALINAASKALSTPAQTGDGTAPAEPDVGHAEQTLEHLSGLAQQIALMAQAMNRPKQILRGPDGRASGIA